MLSNSNHLPGFTALSDEVYLLESSNHTPAKENNSGPDTIILFTWGDGQPKYIIKYADGYRTLYPHARIIIVTCTLVGSMYQTVFRRTRAMLPVVDSAAVRPDISKSPHPRRSRDRVLVQIMSNSGTVSLIATLLAYKLRCEEFSQPGEPFPCKLLVFDSAPGGISLVKNLGRRSHALAVAAGAWVPLPLVAMQALWLTVLLLAEVMQRLTRWPAVGRLFPGPISDPTLVPKDALRLFLYSKADKMVGWEDVESHVA